MIFSRQLIESAMMQLSKFYDKILLIDFITDTYQPIKVDKSEACNMPPAFSLYFNTFLTSPLCKFTVSSEEDMNIIFDMDFMASKQSPTTFRYQKFIDYDYHDVEMIIIPIGEGKAFLFVGDITLLTSGDTCVNY